MHGRCSTGPICLSVGDKDLENLPEAVTQKHETPVLFFYSDTPRTVRVKVDFPDGIISQFFPKATAFSPALGELHHIGRGDMSWEIELDPTITQDRFPWVAHDDIWAPSRQVPATPLRVENEHERFIFYRGLGRFTPPIRVTSIGTTATIANDSNDVIPAAFHLVRDTSGRGAWRALGPIANGASTSFDTATPLAEGYLFETAWADPPTRIQALAQLHAELGRFAAPHLARLFTLAQTRGHHALAAWLAVRHEDACLARF